MGMFEDMRINDAEFNRRYGGLLASLANAPTYGDVMSAESPEEMRKAAQRMKRAAISLEHLADDWSAAQLWNEVHAG